MLKHIKLIRLRKKPPASTLLPPVTPRVRRLPLQELDWPHFESLCVHLALSNPDADHVQSYGTQGQAQKGIDLFVRRRSTGRYTVWQCKRYKVFGLGDIRSAVHKFLKAKFTKAGASLVSKTDIFILAVTADLSRTELAEELERQAKALWKKKVRFLPYDVNRLCRELKTLPQVVEDFFGEAWREAFCGSIGDRIHQGLLYGVPNPPAHHLGRDYSDIRDGLVSPENVTGPGNIAIKGMGGIGKTVLAATLCHDTKVREVFKDGLFWITLGRKPNTLLVQTELAGLLKKAGFDIPSFVNAAIGAKQIRDAIKGRFVLLVFDDVWAKEDLEPLLVTSAPSRLLFTTRSREVVMGLGAKEEPVDLFSPAESLRLLAGWTGENLESLPIEAAEIAKKCGYLPLALAMVAGTIEPRAKAWGDALDRLRRTGLKGLDAVFEASLKALKAEDRNRYLDLSVFNEDELIPDTQLSLLPGSGAPGG